MSKEHRILELKSELRAQNELIEQEARLVATRLRLLAKKLERAAAEGAESVDRVFETPQFIRDHIDWTRGRAFVGIDILNKFRDRDRIIEYLDDYQEHFEEEAAAAAIHAGLKGEDEDEWVIWQWANGDWHEIPGNWPTSEDALSEVKDLRDKNPETPFRFSKRNHVWG